MRHSRQVTVVCYTFAMESPQVSFDEDQGSSSPSGDNVPMLARFVISVGSPYVKDTRQAMIVLIVVMSIAFVASFLLLSNSFFGGGKKMSPQELQKFIEETRPPSYVTP